MSPSLIQILTLRCPEGAVQLQEAVDSGDTAQLARAFASAFRWFGKESLVDAGPDPSLLQVDGEIDWSRWRLDDLARAVILQAGLAGDPGFLENVSRYFDLNEEVACARALPLMPDPERFTLFAEACCRSNSGDVVEAMAWGNPYPARHFDDRAFNHMILKLLFMELSLDPVVGLDRRVNPETLRMARDWATELRSAGRPLPEGLDLITQLESST